MLAEARPEAGEERGEREDQPGIHRLKPGRRNLPAKQGAVGVLLGENVDRRPGLLEGHPEEDVEGHEEEDRGGGATILGPLDGNKPHHEPEDYRGEHRHDQRREEIGEGVQEAVVVGEAAEGPEDEARDDKERRGSAPAIRGQADVGEVFRPEDRVEDEAGDHADGGSAEAPVPANLLAEGAADERAQEGPEVDPHVKNGERPVAAWVSLLVELPDHHRHARFEVAGPEDDDRQSGDEHRHPQIAVGKRPEARGPEDDVADGNEEAANDHRTVGADQLVGDDPAEDREQVGKPRVPAVKGACRLLRPARPGIGPWPHGHGRDLRERDRAALRGAVRRWDAQLQHPSLVGGLFILEHAHDLSLRDPGGRRHLHGTAGGKAGLGAVGQFGGVQAGDEIKDEQPAHPVVAEAFPHLHEEEEKQPRRMPEDRPLVRLGHMPRLKLLLVVAAHQVSLRRGRPPRLVAVQGRWQGYPREVVRPRAQPARPLSSSQRRPRAPSSAQPPCRLDG